MPTKAPYLGSIPKSRNPRAGSMLSERKIRPTHIAPGGWDASTESRGRQPEMSAMRSRPSSLSTSATGTLFEGRDVAADFGSTTTGAAMLPHRSTAEIATASGAVDVPRAGQLREVCFAGRISVVHFPAILNCSTQSHTGSPRAAVQLARSSSDFAIRSKRTMACPGGLLSSHVEAGTSAGCK